MFGVTLHVHDEWTHHTTRNNIMFIMDKLCKTPRSAIMLEKLNDLRLWPRVSRSRGIVTTASDQIEDWVLNGTPMTTSLTWPTRRSGGTQL